MRKPPKIQNNSRNERAEPRLVNADTVAARYGVSGRYILQLAAQGKIPSLRLGRKCVRFDPDAVAAALEG